MSNPTQFPNAELPFLIEGPAGPLELLVLPAKNATSDVGIICHPHPQHGGAMTNKVVHTISRAFHNKGLHAVRFNFRGVGQSAGTFDNSRGEVDDLLAVWQWVKSVLPEARIWLAGFSFGSYIAAKGASMIACQQLFTIAPAVHHQPYQELGKIDCPWIVIQGDKDEVVPPPAVYAAVAAQSTLQPNISLYKVDASHFFHGQLIVLRTLIENLLVNHP